MMVVETQDETRGETRRQEGEAETRDANEPRGQAEKRDERSGSEERQRRDERRGKGEGERPRAVSCAATATAEGEARRKTRRAERRDARAETRGQQKAGASDEGENVRPLQQERCDVLSGRSETSRERGTQRRDACKEQREKRERANRVHK